SIGSTLRLDEMRDLRDHAADRGRVLDDDRAADAREPEAAQRLTLARRGADRALAQRHLEHLLAHPCSSPSGLPRRLAIVSGVRSSCSAANVARTMLCGLCEPMHLVSTLAMPASSTTARTPPPAMTPVPSDAGRSMTAPAPKRPTTS